MKNISPDMNLWIVGIVIFAYTMIEFFTKPIKMLEGIGKLYSWERLVKKLNVHITPENQTRQLHLPFYTVANQIDPIY